MQIVSKSLFTKGVQNVHHLHGHMLSLLVNCSVNNNLSEVGPYRNYAFLHYVKDRERTKSKMLVFYVVLIFTFIFVIFGRYLLDR